MCTFTRTQSPEQPHGCGAARWQATRCKWWWPSACGRQRVPHCLLSWLLRLAAPELAAWGLRGPQRLQLLHQLLAEQLLWAGQCWAHQLLLPRLLHVLLHQLRRGPPQILLLYHLLWLLLLLLLFGLLLLHAIILVHAARIRIQVLLSRLAAVRAKTQPAHWRLAREVKMAERRLSFPGCTRAWFAWPGLKGQQWCLWCPRAIFAAQSAGAASLAVCRRGESIRLDLS